MSEELATVDHQPVVDTYVPPRIQMPALAAGVVPQMPEIGRIRLGEKRKSQKGSLYPAALETFRLTSPDRQLIEQVADLYGGTVKEFNDQALVPAQQWQVVTTSKALNVYVPNGGQFSSMYERWDGSMCLTRTDGVRDLFTGEFLADPCPNDPASRKEWMARFDVKLTTRMSVMLRDVPALGVWRLESHGLQAGDQLAASAMLMAMTGAGWVVPATLTLEGGKGNMVVGEKEAGKKGVKRRDNGQLVQRTTYVYPVLKAVDITPHDLHREVQKAQAEHLSAQAEFEAANRPKALHAKSASSGDDPFAVLGEDWMDETGNRPVSDDDVVDAEVVEPVKAAKPAKRVATVETGELANKRQIIAVMKAQQVARVAEPVKLTDTLTVAECERLLAEVAS